MGMGLGRWLGGSCPPCVPLQRRSRLAHARPSQHTGTKQEQFFENFNLKTFCQEKKSSIELLDQMQRFAILLMCQFPKTVLPSTLHSINISYIFFKKSTNLKLQLPGVRKSSVRYIIPYRFSVYTHTTKRQGIVKKDIRSRKKSLKNLFIFLR